MLTYESILTNLNRLAQIFKYCQSVQQIWQYADSNLSSIHIGGSQIIFFFYDQIHVRNNIQWKLEFISWAGWRRNVECHVKYPFLQPHFYIVNLFQYNLRGLHKLKENLDYTLTCNSWSRGATRYCSLLFSTEEYCGCWLRIWLIANKNVNNNNPPIRFCLPGRTIM